MNATEISELKLPFLPMEEMSFSANPWPALDAARGVHPWLGTCTFGYVVHGHRAIGELLGRDEILETTYGDDIVELLGAAGTGWGRFQQVQLLNLSGDTHKRVRSVVAPLFTPAAARRNRDLMRETMQRLLNEWAPLEAFDFEEFVSYYPISVMSAIIGAPVEEVPRLRSSMEALGLAFGMDREYMPKVEEGYLLLDKFVQTLVEERRANPQASDNQNLLDVLIAAVEEGQISDREMYDFLIFAYVGGYDTSKNALTLLMSFLIDRPDMYARCSEDMEYCRKVMEEGFRFQTTSTFPRRVKSEFVYEDVVFPAGTLLFFPVSVSGRDPNCFEEPDTFDPDRKLTPTARHIAFGRGVHICLGQYIARHQIEVGLNLIAQHLKNPKLSRPAGHRPFFGVWGLKGLHIEFEDAARSTGNSEHQR